MQDQATHESYSPSVAPGDRALPIETVMHRLGCKRTRVYAMIKSGEFPKPTKFGRQSRWSEKALDTWLQQRFAAH